MRENKKRVFLCYHYENEHVLAQKIQKVFLDNHLFSINGVETQKMDSELDVREWIDDSLKDNDIVLLIVGNETLKRKWVLYELNLALKKGQTVIGFSFNQNCAKKTVRVLGQSIDVLSFDQVNEIPKELEKYVSELRL